MPLELRGESELQASARLERAQQDAPQPELQDVEPQAQPVLPEQQAGRTPPPPLEMDQRAALPAVQQEAHPALPVSPVELLLEWVDVELREQAVRQA